MDGLLKRMEQDAIPMSPLIFICAVECLGRLIELYSPDAAKRPSSPSSVPRFPDPHSLRNPLIARKLMSVSKEAVLKIEQMLQQLGNKAEAQV